MTDDERLAQVIADSLQQVERYFDDDAIEAEDALRALDRADAAMEKLNAKLSEFRERLDDIIRPDVWLDGKLHLVRAI